MKKIFIALALFIAIATQGQTNTITSQLKLGTVNTGSTSDDILVRGTDKIVKKITVSNLLSTIPAQVNADWEATSGTAEILNKPTIPTIVPQVNADWDATSGVAQILNKPIIPDVSGLATTTYVNSQDSGLQSQINGKQATLVSGTNIKTINGTTLLGSGDIVISGGSLPNGMLRTVGSGVFTSTLQQISDNTNVLTPVWMGTTGITSTGNVTNTSKFNTSFGLNAGSANTAGLHNSFFGANAGLATTAGSNTAVGSASFSANTIGTSNTIVGRIAFGSSVSGNKNVVIGDSAGFSVTAGDDNIYIGYNCARGGTSGNNNIIIGSGSSGLDTGSNYNVVIGTVTSAAKAVLQNNVILADGAGNKRMQIDAAGKTNLLGGVSAVIAGVYEDNAAATAGGVPVNTFYRTSTGVLMIRY